jgi:hypothetical protein
MRTQQCRSKKSVKGEKTGKNLLCRGEGGLESILDVFETRLMINLGGLFNVVAI